MGYDLKLIHFVYPMVNGGSDSELDIYFYIPKINVSLWTMGSRLELPSGYVKIAIENGSVETVGFPIKHGVSFQFAM